MKKVLAFLGLLFAVAFAQPATVSIPDGEVLTGVAWNIDNTLIETDTEAPFELNYNPATYTPGTHTIEADITLNIPFVTGAVIVPETFTVTKTTTFQGANLAGQICPSWVHDLYTVQYDGATYQTWHPQTDPTYGCHFTHEHGSDPMGFAPNVLAGSRIYQPPFGYFNSWMQMHHNAVEGNPGYKIFVFDRDNCAPGINCSVMMWMHFGTAGAQRLCMREHTTGIMIANRATGEILANMQLAGDYGKTEATVEFGEVAKLYPDIATVCPWYSGQNPGAITGTAGKRSIVAAFNSPTSLEGAGYETWRLQLPPRQMIAANNTFFPWKGVFLPRTDEHIMTCNETRLPFTTAQLSELGITQAQADAMSADEIVRQGIPEPNDDILQLSQAHRDLIRTRYGYFTFTCTQLLATTENGQPRDGIERWFDLNDNYGIDTVRTPSLEGNFCTTPQGISVACTDPHAVEQFAKVDIVLNLSGTSTRFAVPPANISLSGENAFKFTARQPGENNYKLTPIGITMSPN